MLVGYRTIIFNLVMAVIAAIRVLFPDLVLPADEEITKTLEAIWTILILGGNLGLRVVTKGPVGLKIRNVK